MDILVQRLGAFGDVLLVTPVIRRLRRENPGASIDVLTLHPNALQGNPDVTNIGGRLGIKYDKWIDLNFVSELHPELHAVDAYFLETFGDLGDDADKQPVFIPGSGSLPPPLNTFNWYDWTTTICVHPNVSWPGRTLSAEFWGDVVKHVKSLGVDYKVVSLGTPMDHDLSSYGAIDTRGRLDTAMQQAVISNSACFIGFTSGLLALAYSTDTPIVSMDTMSKSTYSAQYRRGVLGWNSACFETELACRGCLDRARQESLPAPITFLECPLGTNACVETFDAEGLVQAAMKLISHDLRRVEEAVA